MLVATDSALKPSEVIVKSNVGCECTPCGTHQLAAREHTTIMDADASNGQARRLASRTTLLGAMPT